MFNQFNYNNKKNYNSQGSADSGDSSASLHSNVETNKVSFSDTNIPKQTHNSDKFVKLPTLKLA